MAITMSNPPVIERATQHPVPIRLPGSGLSDLQFFEFCQLNKELRIERQADGKIIVMSPTSTVTGNQNFNLALEVGLWNRAVQLGLVFDSSTGFTLPGGAVRSPDVAWILKTRWEALTSREKAGFAAICPDFILELRSESDSLTELTAKMAEYLAAGCRLAWLVDPVSRKTTVFQPDAAAREVAFEDVLDGEAVLPEFRLKIADTLPA